MRGRPDGTMTPARLLYYSPVSHYCVAAERMLRFKRLNYRVVPVSYHDHQRVLADTGQDYVPALREGEEVVTWAAIPDHLEREAPTPTLYPGGQRGLARAIENWGHQVLEERVWRYVVTRIPAALGSEAERWVFEELQVRSRGPWKLLQRRRPEFRRDLIAHLRIVEEMLRGRDWILGAPSLADFGVFGSLSPLVTAGEPWPAPLPALRRWYRRIEALGAAPAR